MHPFLTILAEYGLVSTIMVICVVVIFIFIRSKQSVAHSADNSSPLGKYDPNEKIKPTLAGHEFFSNVEFKINIDLPIETFSDRESRNLMYRDMMIYLFSSYHRNMRSFVLTHSSSWTTTEWVDKINKTHYNIIQEFNEECIRNSVPEVAVKMFMSWYNPYINKIYQYINYIAKTPDMTIAGKTRVFLLVLELILATLTADAQRAPKLNGELDGLEYKGLPL